MASETNSIEMLLKVSAMVQGMGAIKQLGETMKQGAKQAGLANVSFMKMAKGAALIALGFKGMMGAMDFFKSAISEADAAVKAEEKLGAALGRRKDLAIEAAKKGVTIESQTKALSDLAEQMEKTGVVSATALKSGFAGLTGIGFSPKRIKDISLGYEGLIVALKGVGASAGDIGDVNTQIKQIIKLGGKAKLPAEWKQIASKEQIERYKKLGSGAKAVAWIQEVMAKNEWRIAAAMGETEGKLWRADAAWKRMQETLGKPFAKTRLAFAQAGEKIANALTPVAERLSSMMTPQLEKFAGWIDQQGPAIENFGNRIADAFQWVIDHWEVVSKGINAIGIAFGTWAVIGIVTSPITALIAGLTLLAGTIILVVDNWDKIAPAAQAAWDGINNSFIQPIASALKPIWEPLVKGAQELWSKLSGPLGDIVNNLKSFFEGKVDWTTLWKGLGESFSQIGSIFASFDWGKLGTDIFNGIKTAVAGIDWNAVGASIRTAGQAAINNALKFGVAAMDIAIKIGNIAIEGTMNLLSWASAEIGKTNWGELATKIGEGVGTALKNLAWGTYVELSGLWTALTTASSGASTIDWSATGKSIMDGLGTFLTNSMKEAAFLGNIAMSFVNGLATSLSGQSWDALSTALVTGFNSGLTAIIAAVTSWGGQIVSAIVSGMGGLGAAIQAKANEALAAVSFGLLGGEKKKQLGGLVASPTHTLLGERGPEMVIPIRGGERSKGMLAQTAQMLGMGGMMKGGGGTGPMNVNVSIPVNISGVPTGQEGAVGREVERALQDPIRNLLEQMRKARDEEHRTAYV